MITGHTAYAEVTETSQDRFYYISPNSPFAIKQELKRMTPIRERGGSFNGRTTWSVQWKYQTTGDQNGCKIHDVEVHLSIDTILPALSQYVTDERTIQAFNNFSKALTAHERNHGEHGRQAAHEIDKALGAITPQRDCNAVSRMAEQLSQQIIATYSQKDRDYDYYTRNGQTEGAWLR